MEKNIRNAARCWAGHMNIYRDFVEGGLELEGTIYIRIYR